MSPPIGAREDRVPWVGLATTAVPITHGAQPRHGRPCAPLVRSPVTMPPRSLLVRTAPAVLVLALLQACRGASPPTTSPPTTSPPPAPPTTAASPTPITPTDADLDPAIVDQNLRALAAQGESLADHIGPEATQAIIADLDRHPAVYLDAFERLFVTSTPAVGYESWLLTAPLWRLRRYDEPRVRALAARVVLRYEELSRAPPDPADVDRASRIMDRVADMSLVRDGLDVPAGTGWQPVPMADLEACMTATPDGTPVIRVRRICSCGEPLSCQTTTDGTTLRLDVRFDPDAPARCTDCYPMSTSCSLPVLPPSTNVPVVADGTKVLGTWVTDARGWPTGQICKRAL